MRIFFQLDFIKKRKVFFIFFLILITGMLEVFTIATVFPLLSIITNQSFYYEYQNFFYYLNIDEKEIFKLFFFVFIFLLTIKNIIQIFHIKYEGSAIFNFQENISYFLFKKILNQDYLFHINSKSSDFIAKIKNEVGTVILYCMALMTITTESIMLLGIFILLFFFSPVIFIKIILVIIISIIFFYLIFYKKIKKTGVQRLDSELRRLNFLTEGFNGVRELKIFGILDKFIDNYRKLGLELAHINYENYFYLRFPKIFLEITIIIVIIVFSIIFYKNLNYQNLNNILPIIGTYIIAAYRVLPSVNRLMNSFTQLKLYKPGLNEIEKILLIGLNVSNKKKIYKRQYYKFNKLKFKDVSFGYLENNEIFSKINFTIKKKDKVFIFGKTGKGKSTFLNLVIGLIKPSSGKITYNNKTYELSDIINNNTLSYAPQNTHLFDKSMQFNISLSENLSTKNYEILIRSVKSAELNEFLGPISTKQDVNVGESGNRLSGGQKQRVGIARCLYKNSEILILDESTSSLDSYTELKVLTNIFNNYSDKTIIFVSHKRDLIKKFAFNKIFELKKKGIVKINN